MRCEGSRRRTTMLREVRRDMTFPGDALGMTVGVLAEHGTTVYFRSLGALALTVTTGSKWLIWSARPIISPKKGNCRSGLSK